MHQSTWLFFLDKLYLPSLESLALVIDQRHARNGGSKGRSLSAPFCFLTFLCTGNFDYMVFVLCVGIPSRQIDLKLAFSVCSTKV